MNVLTHEDLQELTSPHEGWCISIYMPTIEKSQEVRQNPIRFKNLLDQAEEQLTQAGLENTEIRQTLEPAQDLRNDVVFWQHQDDGLAVFLARDILKTYRLPMSVDEQVVVNERFYLKPLMPLLYGEDEFLILALSQKQVRLIKASEHHAEEIDVPNMPGSMDETLGYDNIENQVQWHTGTSNPASSDFRGAMFHGHSVGDDKRKAFILNYFREVDRAVSGYLKDNKAPLILASVEYLAPIYHDANTYKHLAEEVIHGNYDDVKPTQIRDHGWDKIKHVFKSEKENIIGQYKQLSGGKDRRAVKDLKEVIKAAPYGRVEVLFVDKNARQWGTFDEENIEVKFEKEPHPGNQDLLDFAALQTLLNGGMVFVVEPQEVPESGSPVAAILRY